MKKLVRQVKFITSPNLPSSFDNQLVNLGVTWARAFITTIPNPVPNGWKVFPYLQCSLGGEMSMSHVRENGGKAGKQLSEL